MQPDIDQIDATLEPTTTAGRKLLVALVIAAMLRATYGHADLRAIAWGLIRFNDNELHKLTTALVSAIFAAELLGRSVVRTQAEAERKGETPKTVKPFPWMTTAEATDYFTSISQLFDPTRLLGIPLDTAALKLAMDLSNAAMDRVKKDILKRLESGETVNKGDIVKIIKSAKVDDYGDLAIKGVMLEVYRHGWQFEFLSADLDKDFPVWQYMGIDDDVTRRGPAPKPDHAQHFHRYFSREVMFEDVRGREPQNFLNCRCWPEMISLRRWLALNEAGATLTRWP